MSRSWSARELLGFGVSKRAAVWLVGALFIAACSDDGCSDCSCGGFEQGPYPANAPHVELSGQVRITPSGLNFVEDNLGGIVAGALPDGLSFCVPESNMICQGSTCSDGSPGCDLSMTIDDASISTTPPDTLNVAVIIGGLDETLPIEILGAPCEAKLELRGNSSLPGQIEAGLPVTFSVDPITEDVQIQLGEISINFDDLKIEIDPGPDANFLERLTCEGTDAVAGIGFVRDLITGQLTPELQTAVDDIVGEQLCRTCDASTPCSVGTCDEGVCRYPDDRCVPRTLGIEGKFLLGDALADFTEHPESAMDLVIKAADYTTVNDGVTIGLRSGYEPDMLRRCVPSDPTRRPSDAPVALSNSIVGNTKPGGQPFMFGLGYHKRAVQHLLWSVWGSGATCLLVSSDSLDSFSLSTSLFASLLPSLRDVTASGSAVYIKIVPQKAPDVILGQNTVTPSGESYSIDDPLITIDWKDMDIHIYAFGQERWTRLFTLRGDLQVPVAIVPGMNQITPIIGDLSAAISNVRPIEYELVAEDEQKLKDLLPTLLGVALPALAGSLVDPIDLPDLLGLQLAIGQDDITSVDNNEMIAIYANLATTTQPYRLGVKPIITSSKVHYETKESGFPSPKVELGVMALPTDLFSSAEELEFSWRVGDGFWSHWTRSNKLQINDPTLVIPGAHRVEVRARYMGRPESESAIVAAQELVIDWDEPTVQIERNGLKLSAFVEDTVPQDVMVRWRLVGEGHDGSWSAWSSEREFVLTHVPDGLRVDVEARDREGRVSGDTRTIHQTLGSAPTEPKTGCNSAGGAPLWALLLLPLFFIRRKNALKALALTAVLLGTACSDDATTPSPCASCPDGTYCGPENSCVEGCQTAQDCAEGQQCSDGACVSQCEASCAEQCGPDAISSCGTDDVCVCTDYCDGGCEDGAFCCRDSNSCQVLEDPCGKTVCDEGFGPVVVQEPSGDEATCEIDAGACECQELPPLPLGFHGMYLSMAQAGSTTLVAAYNATYTDLMVGAFEGAGEPVWYFVDGVPASGDVTGSLNGPRGGIRDRGDDLGTHTAIAVDSAGVAHIFYRDEEEGVMKYARGTGSGTDWSFETKAFDETVGAGFYPDALVKDGQVHVVYLADNVGEAGAGFNAEIRHATFAEGDAFSAVSADFGVVYTAGASNPCGGNCRAADRCFVAQSTCARPSNDCAGDCAEGTACFEGTCLAIYEAPAGSFPGTTGLLNQLQETTDGLILSFYDHRDWSGAYTVFDGSAWATPTFIGTPSGPYVSAVMDSNSEIHVAFMDPSAKRLAYRAPGGAVEMIADGLRDTSAGWIVNEIGEDVMLRFNANDELVALFQDSTRHTLHLATRGGNGWTIQTLAGRDVFTGSHGFYATMLKAPEDIVVAAMTYQQREMPPYSEPVVYTP